MASKKGNTEAAEVEVAAPAAESDTPPADPRKTIGEHAEARGIPAGYWKLTAAKTHRGWSEQTLITEDEFEAAMNHISNQIIR